MELPTNAFRRAQTTGETALLGTWLMAASPVNAEALGFAGFDFLVVDLEHVPIEVPHKRSAFSQPLPTRRRKRSCGCLGTSR